MLVTHRRAALLLAAAIVLTSGLPLAARAARDAPERIRLTLESVEPRGPRGLGETLSRIIQLLRLRAVGVIAPRPGMRFRVTAVAYSSTVRQTDRTPCITAAGTRVRPGIVATNFLPLGTRLKIGDDVYVAEDRMNERYNGVPIIDIWFPTIAQASTFGARQLEIEILGVPKRRAPAAAPTPAPAPAPPPAPSPPAEPTVLPPAVSPTPAPVEIEPTPAPGFLARVRARILETGQAFRRFLAVRVAVPEEEDCLLLASPSPPPF